MISVDGVSFSVPKKNIIKDISFTANNGEMTGIVGPNGAGKTTLLRCIAKINKVDSGSITIENKDIYEIGFKDYAKLVSFCPSNVRFDLDFTCLDVVLMGRYSSKNRFGPYSGEDYEIAKEALLKTDLEEHTDDLATNLSSGETQLLLIARAIAQNSKIILLDEPLANLDIKNSIYIMRFLKKLCTDLKMSVVIVLHDLNFALNFCDNLLLMNAGRAIDFQNSKKVLKKENILKAYGIDVNFTKFNQNEYIEFNYID